MVTDVNLYKKVDLNSKVASASPHRLIQMLYEGAVSNLNGAGLLAGQQSMTPQQRKMFDRLLCKTIEVVGGLQDALDTSLPDELPHNLDLLYDYIQRRLLHARIQRDVSAVMECQSLLETLKSGWDAIAKKS